MIYMRGHPGDYDRWRDLGNPGWSYADVLPCFKKAEHNERGTDAFHGAGGPLQVADLRSPNPLSRAFVEAASELGLPLNADFNGAQQLGFGLHQVTQKNGRRHSAAAAYLAPNLGRPNLRVVTQALASRILIEGGRATGVEYLGGGPPKGAGAVTVARAGHEVILCGGAVNSPQLLMLSGIGPAEHLRALGITVVADLPGVGGNLQDHPSADAQWTCRRAVSLAAAESLWSLFQYLLLRTGPLSSNVAEAGGFLCTRPGDTAPDIQLHFCPVLVRRHYDTRPERHGFSCCVTLLGSPSHGRVRLRSASPQAAPAIDPDYLAASGDWAALREGVRLVRRLAATRAFAPFGVQELVPGVAAQDDNALDDFLRARLETLYHPAGTCKMGSDPLAVVDPQLRVRAVTGLRVADASVMPALVRGNTNAPTIMIAEKAADLIRRGECGVGSEIEPEKQ
jgi:choline dehydrogenase